MIDMVIKGRGVSMVLSPVQALKIKQSIASGSYSVRDLATEYCVSEATIYDIRAGRTWRHLDINAPSGLGLASDR